MCFCTCTAAILRRGTPTADIALTPCLQSKRNAVAELLQKPASQLDRADARCYACWTVFVLSFRRGYATPVAAASFSTYVDFIGTFMSSDPMVSRKKMPSDAVPTRMASLLLELIQSDELPQILHASAWHALNAYCALNRPAVSAHLLQCGIFEVILAELRKVGSPAVRVCSASLSTLACGRTLLSLTAQCAGMAVLVAFLRGRWRSKGLPCRCTGISKLRCEEHGWAYAPARCGCVCFIRAI